MTMIVIICDCFASDDHDHDANPHRWSDDDHDCDCFVSDDHDHDDNSHRLEDIRQLGDDGGVEGGEEGHRAQEVDLVLQLLQTWSAELLGIMQNY